MRYLKYLIVAVCLWGAWHAWQGRAVGHVAPGVATMAEPLQTATSEPAFDRAGYHITPLASFDIEARVLSREDYSLGKEADLSPTDLALGWGRMSDSAVYGQLTITQGSRFYYWHYDNEPPIPPDEIVRSSANMHMIPATDAVRRALRTVRVGQIVHLRGQLIEAQDPTGWQWRSSLTREDSGAGACEVVWVEDLQAH